MGISRSRLQPSSGTRTAWGTIRAGFRSPAQESSLSDLEALRHGEGRVVSCILKGSVPPYPRHPKQGLLELTSGQVSWHPSWTLSRRRLLITKPLAPIEVQNAGRSQWNVKKGGKAFGVVPIPEFKVVVVKTTESLLELSVPMTDVELVTAALQQERTPPGSTQSS